MRLDLPQNLPRRRLPEASPIVPSIEPSPIEVRRETLAARAANRRAMPQAPQSRSHHLASPSKTDRHKVERDRGNRAIDRRPRRQTIAQQVIGLSLREEERKVLAEVGRFRVVATQDLAQSVYYNRQSLMERDLSFLRDKKLIDIDTVNARRDGRAGNVEQIEVVTLTKGGQSLARLAGGLPLDQKLYSGMVKPREVQHDTQIYRAYRKEAERIEQKGGTNLRVRLDFELKSDVQKAIHAARTADPGREMRGIKRQVAQQFDLPYVNNSIQIPDARIEYDLEPAVDQERTQSSRSGHEDIEVLTAAYHAGHLRSKAQAGFRNYASAADRCGLSAKIEDDQHLIEDILEL